ncbi:ABC transporter ATP-binding protein [Paenibacillus sp. GSMTC-2017]|uniref:ABC transporter ATP-binding protein n=1 Tax=Paenibacillus sp. GSMTC-2017 TaxID=2794350 RepID=UPI0018D5E296|nr:ABC transporter ATP-binding protein [Paenibacillus sp. GSMTC-2017]MBH5318894.1 ABC transporter ATP-binding protein [Paenibacillus sp. GSMTC-2017]
MTISAKSSSYRILMNMMKRAKKHWLSYLGVSVIAVSASLLPVGWAEAMRQLFDAAKEMDKSALKAAAILFGILFASELFISTVRAFLMQKLSNRTTLELQREVLHGLFIMRMAKFMGWHTGDKLQRMNQSATSAQTGMNQKLPELIQNSLSIVFLFIYLTVLSWELMAGAIVVALLIPLLSNWLGKPIRKNQELTNESQAKTDAALLDQLQGGEVTRSYGLRASFNEQWGSSVETTRRRWLRTDFLRTLTNSSIMIGFSFGQAYILGMGAWMVVNGTLSIGAIAAFILSYERLVFPMAHLTNSWAAVQDAIAHAGRVLELTEESPAKQNTNTIDINNLSSQADIHLDNVTFRYGDKLVISNFSASFAQGRTTALVGPSGSGKSTILKLLLGLYPADSGTIHYGKSALNDANWKQWREQAAYLPQDTAVLDATVAENIRIGRQDATDDDIVEAAKLANAHSFIEALPDGYNSRLGESGGRLSGGEKQRLALARAYVRNPRILLLDEPTSALDATNESLMQEALQAMKQDRTVIVVAHRLSTVRDADCILYVENGQLMEAGTHYELMSQQGRYASLVQAGEWADGDEVLERSLA